MTDTSIIVNPGTLVDNGKERGVVVFSESCDGCWMCRHNYGPTVGPHTHKIVILCMGKLFVVNNYLTSDWLISTMDDPIVDDMPG